MIFAQGECAVAPSSRANIKKLSEAIGLVFFRDGISVACTQGDIKKLS